MRSPKDTYRQNTAKGSTFRKNVFLDFKEKYFNPSKDENLVFATNERELARRVRGFIPGKIYTFKYNPLYKDVLDYYDKQPIILVHGTFEAGTGNQIVTGINLNFLPEQVRVSVLEYYWRLFKDDINKAEAAVNQGRIGLIQRAIQFLKDWLATLRIFDDGAKVGYEFAYRNYIIDPAHMRGVILVEYEDWEYLPFLQPRDVVGKSLKEIYAEYIKERQRILAEKKKPTPKKNQENKKKFKQ